MNRFSARQMLVRLRETSGFPEVIATFLTMVVFIVSYWFESHDTHNILLFRGIFVVGAILLCGIIVSGVVYRNYVPVVSHLIVGGATLIGVSQIVGFLEVVPALGSLPLIGPQGWGYLSHADDMLLYPGFVVMLCGFYLAIRHATQMRKRLLEEGRQKELALQQSRQYAEILARRVAFENLATSISTRFISVGQDEIDPEIRRSLSAVGDFTAVDRAYFVVARASLLGSHERFEWCRDGVRPLSPELRGHTPADFQWMYATLDRGQSVLVSGPDELPAAAAFEREWILRHGIRSLVRVPIISKGRLRGYIGLDSESPAMQWPDETEPLLRMIGEILLSAWDRRCVAQQRAALELQVQQAQKLESLGVMAGGIAHDFNNILTGIMGNAELAQLGLPENDERSRYLEGIMTSSRRAAELCRQMLAYSGRGKFVTETFCLNALVSEILPLLRASVPRTASLECDLGVNLPLVEGDSSQFRQVLANLVTNASESLVEGRGCVCILTGCQHCTAEFFQQTRLPEPLPPGDYVFLEVRDNGSGMTEEVTEKIFDPFFTTRFAGRGLGLPAVLGIVRSHKGAIELDTSPGKGTVIRLLFPAKDTVARNFYTAGEVLGDWHGRGIVLLADDEEMVVSVGTMMLKHVGLDVVTAADAREALERGREFEHRLQCIILDMNMPGMEGDSTCARFREQFPGVPIVVSSGYMKEDIERRFAPGSVAAFLSKPFELYNVQSIMRDLIEPSEHARIKR